MEVKRFTLLSLGLIFLLTLWSGALGEELSQNRNSPISNSHASPEDSRPINNVRRKIMRKRVFPVTPSPDRVTVSVTVSKSEDEPVEELPKPESLVEDGSQRLRRPFLGNKFRPSFMNRARPLANTSPSRPFPFVRKSSADPEIDDIPKETPSSSFKLKLKERAPFPKYKMTTTEEPTTTLKITPPRKPFPVKKLLKRLKSKVLASTTSSTTPEAQEAQEESEETVEDLVPEFIPSTSAIPQTRPPQTRPPTTTTTTTTTTSTTTTTPAPTTVTSTTQPPTTTTAPTTTTTTTEATTTSTSTTTAPVRSSTVPAAVTSTELTQDMTPQMTNNSSMIIIPVPPSQRKPYHPVIMQVSKTPTTAESFPETRIVTYKLNKMFVPMGIYGKVLPKSSSPTDMDVATQQKTIVSTPLPFVLPGIDKEKKGGVKQTGPEIKVKGHRSKEVVQEPVPTSDSSADYAKAVQYAASQKEHHSRQQKQWEIMMERLKKKKERNMADSVRLTYDYKPDPMQVSLTTEKVNINTISLTTEAPLSSLTLQHHYQGPLDNRRGQQGPAWAGNNNGFHEMIPPRPLKNANQKPSKTIFETISDAASSIPGLIHGGLSTLSGYTQAFEDEAAFPRPSAPPQQEPLFPEASQIQLQVNHPQQVNHPLQHQPHHQQQKQPLPQLDSETLEFFRKRPHLLQNRGKKDTFSSPEFSSGFRPVTVPPHFASEYYGSTPKPSPTTASTGFYGSSSPGYSAVNVTSSYESRLQRDPLYQQESGSTGWQLLSSPSSPRTTQRTPKHFLSDDDIDAYRKAVLGTKSTFHSKYSWAGAQTPSLSPTTKSFASQWLEFNNKYSKQEIDEARERISSLFARSETPTYEDMMYMKPPSPKSGSAFDDLLKMFKMGISFGAGHTASSKPAMSYSAGIHNEDSFAGSGSDWVPLTKAGGKKIISFNAGITFGNKPSPTAVYPGTHFSSSSSPFSSSALHESSSPIGGSFSNIHGIRSKYPNPNHYSKGGFYSGNSHYSPPKSNIDYLVSNHDGLGNKHHGNTGEDLHKPTSEWKTVSPSSPTSEFLTNIYYKDKKAGERPSNIYDISPAISTHFNVEDGRKPSSSYWDELTPDAIRNTMKHHNKGRPYSNDPPIEIIPSSQFFREKGNMKDIAAVIKPPEIPDDLVKAALPPHIASIPQLSYPTQQLIQHPNNFKSLSQLQSYFATAQPQPTPQPYPQPQPQLQQNHHHQQAYQAHLQAQQQAYQGQGQTHQHPAPPQPQQVNYQPFHQQVHHQPVHHHQHQVQPQPPPQYQQQTYQHPQPSASHSQVKVTGDSGLGFSNFELPPGLDPDIASLIKTELDKDDIPEEFRKDFLEAQEKEKREKAAGAAQQKANKRMDTKADIKFHKPIPITPTMLTPIRGKPIRASPVPRYVVELARKLKEDKNVQGIVRVSTKRDKGPPIEYLYPVRG